MTAHHDPARTVSGGDDRAEPSGTNAAQGTPRPDTALGARSGDARAADRSIPDPTYGIDPALPGPTYGGAGRGNDSAIASAGSHGAAIAGGSHPNAGMGSTTGGVARGGDTTSTADTFSNQRHGLGESGVRSQMDTGVNSSGAAGSAVAPRDGMADPNDASTLQEGLQHADGSRA